MSNEFKPGHPILFWGAVVLGCLLAGTFVQMARTAEDACPDGVKKQWVVAEFDWKCGDSGVALTDDDL